jgi:heme-degrading monooxygenase HmoA
MHGVVPAWPASRRTHAAVSLLREESEMADEYVVWITTRKLKRGTHDEFVQAWKPRDFPEGMIRAYECYADDREEVVGISIWDSLESRERYRLSETESERRRAMAPFLLDETSGVYVGRELNIPGRG